MTLDEPTTINAWVYKPGPINLRRAERKRDPAPMEPIILAAMIGLNLLLWLWAWLR